MDNMCVHAVFAFSIAAIAVAGFFAILCIIFIIVVVVKLKGIAMLFLSLLWPPYEIGQATTFLSCGFYLLSSIFFYSSPNLSGRRLDVYHTSTYGVVLVRI